MQKCNRKILTRLQFIQTKNIGFTLLKVEFEGFAAVLGLSLLLYPRKESGVPFFRFQLNNGNTENQALQYLIWDSFVKVKYSSTRANFFENNRSLIALVHSHLYWWLYLQTITHISKTLTPARKLYTLKWNRGFSGILLWLSLWSLNHLQKCHLLLRVLHELILMTNLMTPLALTKPV